MFSSSPAGSLTSIKGTDGRTGRIYDHQAFVPVPLEHEVQLSSRSWRAAARAGTALGRLDQAARQVPNPELLRRPTLRREAQSTSALEGTFAPLEQVLAESEDSESNDPALLEVLNYVNAANTAFNWLSDGHKVTVGLLEHVQGLLVARTSAETLDAGRIRTCQVAIGASGAPIEEARFVPMPPGVELNAALGDLIGWINPEHDHDPVVSTAMAHYQFETLHPFNDGNGRIGRLLIVLQLLADGTLREPLLSVSPWFERRRDEYQDHLLKVSATGDWDPWIQFFSRGLEQSAIDTIERVEALLNLQESYLERLRVDGARGGLARDIASGLIGYPSFTVPALSRRFPNATPQGIAAAVRRLVDLKILAKREGSYRHLYLAPEVLSALSSPGPNS